jgi:DNA-binding protein HU-beta
MNKSQLVDSISSKTDTPKVQVEEIINTMSEVVGDEIGSGGKVTVTGFGTFYANKRDAREGVDPQTGERITIPATVTPRFRAGEGLKRKVKK